MKTEDFLTRARARLADARVRELSPGTRYDAAWSAARHVAAAHAGGAFHSDADAFAHLRVLGVIGALMHQQLDDWPRRRYRPDEPVTLDEVEAFVGAVSGMAGH